MTEEKRQILQIMPANGWGAVFLVDDPPYYVVAPMMGWALVEETDKFGDVDRFVRGLDADAYVEFVNEAENFYAYIYEGCITQEVKEGWKEEGLKRLERKAEKRKGK